MQIKDICYLIITKCQLKILVTPILQFIFFPIFLHYQIVYSHRYNNHILTFMHPFTRACLLIIKCTYVLWCKDQLYTTAGGSGGNIGLWLKTFCDVNGMKLPNGDNSYCIAHNRFVICVNYQIFYLCFIISFGRRR